MEIHIKEAIVFFPLGMVQGMILLDWIKEKQANKILMTKGKKA